MEESNGGFFFRTGASTLGGFGTVALTIDATQNVGIGTYSPDAKLSIQRASNGINTEISFKDGGGTRAGVIGMEGATTNDMLLSTLGGIRFYTASDVAVGSVPSNERMRIDSSGNVLIGTTSDLGKVTIQNDAASQYALRIIRSTSASQGLGGFYEGASNEGILYLIDGSNNAGVLLSSDGDSYFNSGNVGIGTNSPDKKLEILSTASNHLRLAYSETAFWDLFQNASTVAIHIAILL